MAVACTQTNLSSARQRALVDSWCDLLPSIDGLKLLWLNSRVPQTLFDAACRVPGLEGLYVKASAIKNASALKEASRLRYLHLGSSPGLESIDAIANQTALEWLGLENLKCIDDLTPLSRLTSLRGLLIEGSMWTTQRVNTLEPIGRLHQLEFLSIANLRTEDATLRPLFTLRNLRRFDAARWWDRGEIEELTALNPGLDVR